MTKILPKVRVKIIKISNLFSISFSQASCGWSGGGMVVDKLPVPGHPTTLDDSRARAYCALL